MQTIARALEGRTALVTGGGSGIGLACARHLARDGATVTLAGRSRTRCHAAETLTADLVPGAEVRVIACDVTDEAAVEAAVQHAAGPGGLDIAVANAGGGAAGSVLTTSVEEWRFTLEVNLIGTFLTVKHAGKAMARGGGAIVAVSRSPASSRTASCRRTARARRGSRCWCAAPPTSWAASASA
jgi:NAD(P)-dependent dehydrogenase (short-subunit alcohol dehydrogenase family)